MTEIEYIGEHALAGQLGTLFTAIAFVGAIFSAISFYFAESHDDRRWLRMGRIGWRIHTLSVLAIMGTLFVMLYNSWYEYDYVWKHRNNAMPLRYIFSCFWEGFEGAFILWALWHGVLGNFIMSKAKAWQAPVLTFMSLANIFILSMVLGIYVFDVKIGNSPFTLIRNLESNIGLPWTQYADYLTQFDQFKDGRGLNPLLQNYWMVIHPPTVFLGFASTIIPAAFAVAGLWRKQYHEWIRPALPWTYLGIGILGTGILMGGVWAYEALSFGGFWAWDPVENASLVPWITLVAAGHVMLINIRKGDSAFTSILLAVVSFIFAIYSNFLTNSGVLGETSVHAFTDNGLSGQLLAYLCFFIALPTGMMLINKRAKMIYWSIAALLVIGASIAGMYIQAIHLFGLMSIISLIVGYNRYFPKDNKEEDLWSREFWMFIASLVLVMAAVQISLMTSKPVFNLLAEPFRDSFAWLYDKTGVDFFRSLATGALTEKTKDEVIQDYNKWQIPFAFITALFVATGQFFKYKKTDMSKWMTQLLPSLLAAIVITVVTMWGFGYGEWHFGTAALLFSSIWAVLSNADYLFRILKGKVKKAGSSIAHIGFAMILLGALVSTSQSKKVSQNTTLMDITQLSEDFNNREDILLFQRDTIMMNDYFVSYEEKERDDVNIFYTVQYFAQERNVYEIGERVYAKGKVFEAAQRHEAGETFFEEQEKYWTELPIGTPITRNVKLWTNVQKGDKVFTLRPRIQLNPVFGNVSEPDTKHYLDRDVYTHIRYGEIEEEEEAVSEDGYRPYKEHMVQLGDTIKSGGRAIVLDSLRKVTDLARYGLTDKDIAVKAEMRILGGGADPISAAPLFVLKEGQFLEPPEHLVEELRLKLEFREIDPQAAMMTIAVSEHKDNVRDFIVMQAIMFPWINILWIGIVVMGLGTFLAVWERFRMMKRSRA